MDNEIRLGTWNVLTLLPPGAKNELLDTLTYYKVDITALQEVRWAGNDILRDKKRKGDIYYSGKTSQ
ncbi:craniofacial development protein 2-like protein, partial [Lasius niger]